MEPPYRAPPSVGSPCELELQHGSMGCCQTQPGSTDSNPLNGVALSPFVVPDLRHISQIRCQSSTATATAIVNEVIGNNHFSSAQNYARLIIRANH